MPLLKPITLTKPLGMKKAGSKLKTGLAIGAGVLGAGALGFAAAKLLGKKKTPSGLRLIKRGSVARLRSRVERLMLKIKLKQLTRKLFKEQLRF